jgi:hypothetical protein
MIDHNNWSYYSFFLAGLPKIFFLRPFPLYDIPHPIRLPLGIFAGFSWILNPSHSDVFQLTFFIHAPTDFAPCGSVLIASIKFQLRDGYASL